MIDNRIEIELFDLFSIFHTVDLGRCVLCRHSGLLELHGQGRFNREASKFETSGRWCTRIRTDQGMDREETADRCLKITDKIELNTIFCT